MLTVPSLLGLRGDVAGVSLLYTVRFLAEILSGAPDALRMAIRLASAATPGVH